MINRTLGSMHDTGCLGLVHWDHPRGMVREGRREEGSGWGIRVYLWRIHVDIWQNQYNIVKLKKNKKKLKKKSLSGPNSEPIYCWFLQWQPTPVFLPGESQGRGSLVGCRLGGHTESDTTEVT